MNTVFRTIILALFLGPFLSGCSDEEARTYTLEEKIIIQDDFLNTLEHEYKNLADYEEQRRNDKGRADFYRGKARSAAWGLPVDPANPTKHDIPDHAEEELITAYNMLIDALDTMFIPENEGLLAIAQTRYDCWLLYREDYSEKEAFFTCKDDFYNALRSLSMPGSLDKTFNIYFDKASTQLNTDAMAVIEDVARHYGDRHHWTVILTGFTDTRGSPEKNKTLSLRRAAAVKNALGQFGVDLQNIAISAAGETAAIRAGISDEQANAEARRVSIAFKPGYVTDSVIREISEAQGWTHIGGDL